MSEHGLGAAIDFNVTENDQGIAARPFGSMDPRIVAIFEAFHFRFGACFNPTDPMHFEDLRGAVCAGPRDGRRAWPSRADAPPAPDASDTRHRVTRQNGGSHHDPIQRPVADDGAARGLQDFGFVTAAERRSAKLFFADLLAGGAHAAGVRARPRPLCSTNESEEVSRWPASTTITVDGPQHDGAAEPPATTLTCSSATSWVTPWGSLASEEVKASWL